jgi:phosphonate transport system substrate-binding protein
MMRNAKIFAAIMLLTVLLLPFPPAAQAEQQKILIGLIPEMNIFKQKQRFKLLGDYLSKKTGIPVEFTILSRYGNIIERFSEEKMDGAFFGSFTGALAIQKLGVVPLARPVNPDNSSTYKGYLFVRKNSGITTVADMKGKKMAFVDKATTAGYVFPLAWLKGNGVATLDGLFSEYYFTGSHDAAVLAVLNNKADIGSAKNTIYDRVRKAELRVDQELVILAASPEVPSNGLCVRKDLDKAIQAKLKAALLSLNNEPEGKAVLEKFGALTFIETTAKDYQPVIDMAKKAGIDMRQYKYRNE